MFGLKKLVVCAFAVPAMALLSVGAATAQEPAKQLLLTLGVIGPVVEYWPVMIATKKGWFEEGGLKIDQVATGGSAKGAQMVTANAVHVASVSTLDAIRAIEGGAPMKITLNNMNTATMMLVGAKDIKDAKDLKGKRVIVGGPNDVTAFWWKARAKELGLDPVKDVEVVFASFSGQRFAALQSGGVEAATITTPISFRAEREGFSNLGVISTSIPGLPYITWVANSNWAKDNGEAIVRFIKVYNKAIAFLYAPENKAEAISILRETANVELADAEATYDLVLELKTFTPDSSVSPDGVKMALELLEEVGDIKGPLKPVETYLDLSFVEKAK